MRALSFSLSRARSLNIDGIARREKRKADTAAVDAALLKYKQLGGAYTYRYREDIFTAAVDAALLEYNSICSTTRGGEVYHTDTDIEKI